MAQSKESTTSSGLDPASFSSVIRPQDDLFRFVNGPWIDTYSLPEDRSRFGSFDKLAEDAEAQIHEILEDPESPAVKSALLYRSFLNTEPSRLRVWNPFAQTCRLLMPYLTRRR